MALHWRPVGPEPAPTYWQRRAVVLVAVLLLVLFLRAVVTGGDGEETVASLTEASPNPVALAAASPSAASPTPSPSPSVVPCTPAALDVRAKAERDEYPVGGRPSLVLTITNTGTAPCSRDLGQGAVELLVVSGADRIWSSDDCNPGGPAKQVVLEPKGEQVTRLAWEGRRSLPGCEGEKAQAAAGTYRVNARVGELRVEGEPFRLE